MSEQLPPAFDPELDRLPGWTRRHRFDVRRYGPVLVQLVGVALLAVGFGMLDVWAGLIAGGLGLMAFGVAAELSDRTT